MLYNFTDNVFELIIRLFFSYSDDILKKLKHIESITGFCTLNKFIAES